MVERHVIWVGTAIVGGVILGGCANGSGDDRRCEEGLGGCDSGDGDGDGDMGIGATTGGAGAGGGNGTGGASAAGGGLATGGGENGSGGAFEPPPDPICEVDDPDEYAINEEPGGGGDNPATSGHFAIYGASDVEDTLNFMEAAHECFVRDWCWRSPGLSHYSDDGPHYKMNIYVHPIDAGGLMGYDGGEGLAFLDVNPNSIDSMFVVVHEFGHALTLTEYGWVNQSNTGLWWESIANFVSESFRNSPHCEDARTEYGISGGGSIINLDAVIERSHLTMCNNSNQYEAWPFFTYLTNNPDNYPGLGKMIVPELFRNHLGNNETPLHVLERLSDPVSVQTILGRYWARMAYVDIASPDAQEEFFNGRQFLDFDILESTGDGSFRVREERQPRYAGANIIPLNVTGDGTVSVEVTNLGNGLDDSNFTATLSIFGTDESVRYVDLPGGSGMATVGDDEEVTLVVANTPDNLYMYNPSDFGSAPTSHPANTGLDYSVVISGASP